MPPIFKNKRKRLRALMSSVLPASIMNSLGTATGTKSLPPLGEQMSVRSWIRLVHMGIRPWDSESVEIWEELNGYRLDKAHHVKEKGTLNEHEYVICEFSSRENGKVELRFDRSAGERKDNDSMNSVPSSAETASTSATGSSVAQSHIGSSSGSSHSSPRGSLLAKSVSSLKARMSTRRSSASLEHKAHRNRLSQSSLPRSSGISLQQHLAADAVTRIESHPKNALLLKTLTLSGDPMQRPNLCDFMVLVDVLYNESDIYSILTNQCYWHADTVFATLEMWAQEHDNGTLSTIGDKKRRQASTGSFKIFPVFRRDLNQVQRIWENFMKGRRLMEEKRAEYERTSKEEIRRKFEDRERHLTSQMRKEQEEKEQQLKKDQEERERRLRREQEERERRLRKELRKEQDVNEQRLRTQLRKEQEEKERRMKKEQEEKERMMKKEQEEKERMMKKEQEELKQQVLDQQRRVELLLRLIGPAPINVSSPPTASITLPDNHP